jgi:D-sedoheptulose 7-phosphate isomerase
MMSAEDLSKMSGSIEGWVEQYRQAQLAATAAIPTALVVTLIDRLRTALAEDRQIFVFGNGGSGANAAHFATDLGKGASDHLSRRFRVICLNDNTSWITALGNDYGYDQVFVRQLMNYAKPGDMVLALSVSGSSPNVVKAVEWARAHGVWTAALVGAKGGALARVADLPIVIPTEHYGRAEDAHMTVCHMLCYLFIENAGPA